MPLHGGELQLYLFKDFQQPWLARVVLVLEVVE